MGQLVYDVSTGTYQNITDANYISSQITRAQGILETGEDPYGGTATMEKIAADLRRFGVDLYSRLQITERTDTPKSGGTGSAGGTGAPSGVGTGASGGISPGVVPGVTAAASGATSSAVSTLDRLANSPAVNVAVGVILLVALLKLIRR